MSSFYWPTLYLFIIKGIFDQLLLLAFPLFPYEFRLEGMALSVGET